MANSFKLGEEAEKTTCPYCKTPLKEGDDVVLCPSCQILHHADCWEENKGCSTFGCSEQHHEMQDTKPTNVCNNCGTMLNDEQAFCPKCGTPKSTPKDTNPMNVCTNCGTTLSNEQAFCPKCGTPKSNPRKKTCSKCGTELQDGQGFCPKCGQKTDSQMDANTNSAISQYNSNVNKANKNNQSTVSFKAYTVKSGDNLLSICEKNGVDYEKNKTIIFSINGIRNPNLIYIGQKILLPIS